MSRFLIVCPLSLSPKERPVLLASRDGQVPATNVAWLSEKLEHAAGFEAVCLTNKDTISSALSVFGLKRLSSSGGSKVIATIQEKSFFGRIKSFFMRKWA